MHSAAASGAHQSLTVPLQGDRSRHPDGDSPAGMPIHRELELRDHFFR
jgi:hypothetical protein